MIWYFSSLHRIRLLLLHDNGTTFANLHKVTDGVEASRPVNGVNCNSGCGRVWISSFIGTTTTRWVSVSISGRSDAENDSRVLIRSH